MWLFFLSVSNPTRTKNKIVTKSSCHTSKPFSATVKGKLFNSDLFPLSFCSRLVFFLQNTYDRKRKYFVLRAPAQRWSLKLYFFQNNHMKTFSVAFTRLKCSEILSVVYKKNGEPFFLKPYFYLSYDLSKRGKNKTFANVDILWRDRQSFVAQTNNHFIQV